MLIRTIIQGIQSLSLFFIIVEFLFKDRKKLIRQENSRYGKTKISIRIRIERGKL